MLSTLKNYANKYLLMAFGPADLDEAHDPVRAEERDIERKQKDQQNPTD